MSATKSIILENDDEDSLFMEQVVKLETSLKETPLRNLKNLGLNSGSKQTQPVKEPERAPKTIKQETIFKPLFTGTASQEDDLLLMENLDKLESVETLKNIKEETSDVDDEDQGDEQNRKYLEVLQKYWGYSSFRKLQLKLIKNTLEQKRDQLIVMATGRGKSLCYQFPSLYSKGLTIVVSPLISLMEDQVMALKMMKVNACLFGTAITKTEKEACIKQALSGGYSIIYMTPELIDVDEDLIVRIDKLVGIDLVAIDECHCISQWGNDFRPAYKRLGRLRSYLKNTPFMALTATATPAVRKDILKLLELNDPIVTVTSFDRPNLYISVSNKNASIIKDMQKFMIQTTSAENKLVYKFDGPTIVYVPTRNGTAEVAQLLQSMGIKAESYNAGMTLQTRKKVQQDFTNDQLDVIVATIAFGMGIDKPDIRNVIHYGAPRELEAYYQEIGRAGRDGQPSRCHIFYEQADFALNRHFIGLIKSMQVREFKEQMLIHLQKFLTTTACRRKIILDHFKSDTGIETPTEKSNPRLNCCDNCTIRLGNGKNSKQQEGEKDFTEEAFNFMSAMLQLKEQYAIGSVISYMMGSRNQKLVSKLKDSQFKSRFFGSGKNKNENWWKSFTTQLSIEGYIKNKPVKTSFGSYSIVQLTDKADEFLANTNRSFKIFESTEMKKFNSRSPEHAKYSKASFDIRSLPSILPLIPVNQIICSSSNQSAIQNTTQDLNIHTEIYKLLMITRNELAIEFSCSAHNVCSNKVLATLAHIRPSDLSNLEKISDFPQAKLDTIGAKLVAKISIACKKFEVEMNNFKSGNSYVHNQPDTKCPKMPVTSNDEKIEELIGNMIPSKQQVYRAFELEKRQLEDIAAERGLAFSTIASYLEEAILNGLPINFTRMGVTMEMINTLEMKIRQSPVNSNIVTKTLIKAQMPDMSWTHLNICLALIRRKYGACKDDLEVKYDASSRPASIINLIEPSTITPVKVKSEKDIESENTSRQIPNWMKRTPSEHDIKDKFTDKKHVPLDKSKKKRKLNI